MIHLSLSLFALHHTISYDIAPKGPVKGSTDFRC